MKEEAPKPVYSDEVLALINMKEEMVPARVLAPIVRMHESVIINRAKRGEWTFSKFIISGERVKFFRIDFLRSGGWIV